MFSKRPLPFFIFLFLHTLAQKPLSRLIQYPSSLFPRHPLSGECKAGAGYDSSLHELFLIKLIVGNIYENDIISFGNSPGTFTGQDLYIAGDRQSSLENEVNIKG